VDENKKFFKDSAQKVTQALAYYCQKKRNDLDLHLHRCTTDDKWRWHSVAIFRAWVTVESQTETIYNAGLAKVWAITVDK